MLAADMHFSRRCPCSPHQVLLHQCGHLRVWRGMISFGGENLLAGG